MEQNNVTPGRYGYSAYDLLNSVIGASDPDVVQANTTEYNELLAAIREKISEEYANTLNGVLTNPDAHNVLYPIIMNYVTDYVNTTNDMTININRTSERIFQDMAGFGILTPFLKDPSVEEININAWNSIEVFWSDHSILLESTFATPQECVDIIRKMVRIGGVHVDYSQPIIDSFIGDGTRISATLPPINQDTIGATASIRKQTYKNVTRESYLNMGFATPKVFDFIRECVLRAISFGFAGSPGAGKTTFMTYLLKDFLACKTTGNNRVITIEEAREIELAIYEQMNPSGGQPRMISRSIQWSTKSGEHPVSARQLIRHTLRYDPQIIVPAEMRGEEAIEAVESGLTGVQIISSFHAWGAKDGYIRVLSMCQMGKSTASETTLLHSIIRAFPLMVFIKKDDDGVRRVHEVFEATGVEDGKVTGNTLFKFVRTKVEEDENGRVLKIHGNFVQYDSISKNLRHLLIQNGARKEFVDQYYFEDPKDNPDHPEQYEDDSQVEVVTIMTGERPIERPQPAPQAAPQPKPVQSTPQRVEPVYQPAPPPVVERQPAAQPQYAESRPVPQPEPVQAPPQYAYPPEPQEPDYVEPVAPEEPEDTGYQEPTPQPPHGGGFRRVPLSQRMTGQDGTPPPAKEPVVEQHAEAVNSEPPRKPGKSLFSDVHQAAVRERYEQEQPAQAPSAPAAQEAPQWNVAPRLDDTPKPRRGGFWGGIRHERGDS